MKARVKETGTLVDAFFDAEKSKECNCPMWACQIGRVWEFYSEKEIEFVNYIDWQSVRKDIAMEILKQIPFDAFNRRGTWIDAVFERANELTKKLMEEIE